MSSLATIRSPSQARASQESIDAAFPKLDPVCVPLGNQVLVQMRLPKQRSQGGLIIVDEVKDADESMVRVAKVLMLGPIAYKNRDTFKDWPEGAWVKVGDYVRVPSFAGIDAWRMFLREEEQVFRGSVAKAPVFVKFALFNDYDIKARIEGDPLAVVDYI